MAFAFERLAPAARFRTAPAERDIMRPEAGATAPRPAGAVPQERALLGILGILATTLLFPISDVASKALTEGLPPVEIAFLRYIVFCLILLPTAVAGGRPVILTGRPLLQIVRGLLGGLSTGIAVLAFSFLPVAEATSIGFIWPIFVTALAALLLKEKVGIRRWTAALAGFAGVMIIVRPGSHAFQAASLLPLAGAFVGAFAIIATRTMKDERPQTTLIYSALFGALILALPAAHFWIMPSAREIGLVLVSGVFAALANLTQVFAYRHGPASVLAPFSYTQLIWASAFGFLAFGNLPGPNMLVGTAVIAASGIYTAYRERVRGVAAENPLNE